MLKPKIALLAFLGILLVFFITGWLVLRSRTPNFTPPPLPSPNGYEGLLQAAEMLHPRTGFHEEMQADELKELVEHNAPALKIARAALELDCGVPVDWTWDPAANGSQPELLDYAQSTRNLVRAFSAEVFYRLSLGQTEEAVGAGLDAYRLGTKCNQGGLMVGHLVGIAIRGVAIHELVNVVAQSPDEQEKVLQGLVPILENNESAEDAIQREVDYISSASRGFVGWMTKRQMGPLMQPAIQAAQQAELRGLATGRLFVLHLAIQLHHEQQGSWPGNIEELSPGLLPEVPLDPYSGASFVYRLTDDSYSLYSVGQNKKDDGGDGDETGQKPDVVYDIDMEAIQKRESR